MSSDLRPGDIVLLKSVISHRENSTNGPVIFSYRVLIDEFGNCLAATDAAFDIGPCLIIKHLGPPEADNIWKLLRPDGVQIYVDVRRVIMSRV